jgi:hypothetical protein
MRIITLKISRVTGVISKSNSGAIRLIRVTDLVVEQLLVDTYDLVVLVVFLRVEDN